MRERLLVGLTDAESRLVLGIIEGTIRSWELEPTQNQALVRAVTKIREARFLREDELQLVLDGEEHDPGDLVWARARDKLRTLFAGG